MARLIAAVLTLTAALLAQSPSPEQIAQVFAAYQYPNTPGCENGNLMIHRRPDAAFALKPADTDGFKCDLGSVHFLRDATGKVVALSLGRSRVWDLRFAREGAGTTVAPH